MQLSLKIILDTGINARQLITLCKSEDSTYKKQGKTVMERQLEHLLYAGKGQGVLYEYLNDYGEAVEIYLDPKLADNLERFKLAKPCEVVSNGVKYLQFYDLVAGAKLRSIFKEGVYNHINFNYSLNILRNLYREKRLKQLHELGFTPLESYFIVNFEFNRQALRAFEVPRAQSKQVSVQKTVIQEKADALDEDQEELSDKNVKEEESSAFESKFTLKSSDLKQKSVLYDENSNSGLLLKFLRLNTK